MRYVIDYLQQFLKDQTNVLYQGDLEDLTISDEASDSSDENSDEDEMDPIAFERRRRIKKQDQLRRTAGEPLKPEVREILKLRESFGVMLRHVLAH